MKDQQYNLYVLQLLPYNMMNLLLKYALANGLLSPHLDHSVFSRSARTAARRGPSEPTRAPGSPAGRNGTTAIPPA